MKKINNRLGLFLFFVLLFWAKTILAYYLDFSLGVKGSLQREILWFNPVATTLLLFGFSLYFKKHKTFMLSLTLLNVLNTLILYLNIIFYREFTDFITIQSVFGFSKVSEGISGDLLALMRVHDVFYWLDTLVLLVLVFYSFKQRRNHQVFVTKPINRRLAISISCLSVLLFSVNLFLSETDRPQLLQRIFDRNYIVKYLGLDAFTAIDGVKTAMSNEVRAEASSNELPEIMKFTKQNNLPLNPQYAGIAKGKNVFVIHLESFQQFLINMKVQGQEVTPFLNQLYQNKATISFDNFFHEVGQGKTSDAENKDLCKAFNRDPKTWTNYDNAQLQRVPLMFYMPGYTQGKIMHEYGGEIDVLPTLYHLLGVDDKNYIHFGTDLLSPQYKQVVPFRNGDFVTPRFSYLGGEIYNNQGKKLDQVPADLKAEVTKDNDWVKKSLSLSDKLNQENLLRFYKPQGFQEVQPKDYNYDVAFEKNKVLEVEKQKNAQSTSLFSQNGNQTTVQNYPTTP